MLDLHSYPDTPADARPIHYVDFSSLPSTSVGEIHFGDLGPRCARHGWAVFPQERDGRKPGIVDGEMLKWKKYQSVGPDVATVDRWSRQAYGLNVAAIMGEASHLCFAVDVDVTDEKLSIAIQYAAAATLGETKFQRIGNWPKIVLIYRVATKDDLPANHSLRFTLPDGSEPSTDAIEFQGQGKAITIHGRHHKTGDRFVWPTGRMPIATPPTFAPVVSTEQLEAFVAAVRDLRPLYEKATVGSGLEGMEFVETDGVTQVNLTSSGGGTWTVTDGLIVDGREGYLTRLVFETVRANPLLALDEAGKPQLRQAILETFRATAQMDAKWTPSKVGRDVAEKLNRNVRQLKNGEIQPSKRALKAAAAPATKAQREALALGGPEVERISAEMRDRVDAFWDDALSYDRAGDDLAPFHLLKSPVGTGKTTVALASTLKTLRLETVLERKAAGAIAGTVGMLLPSHDNVDEVLLKARKLGLQAAAHRGQAHEDGGCAMRETVAVLQSAGISAARLCKSIVDGETVFCPHNPEAGGSCPRLLAMERMLDNDLVVSVHAYALREPPAKFKDFAAVIVDENLSGSLVRTAMLDRAVLKEPRRGIQLTKDERTAIWGDRTPSEEELVVEASKWAEKREWIVALCNKAWDAGRDPAFAIAGYADRRDGLEAARTIVSRASRVAADVSPQTTMKEAAEMATQVQGRLVKLEGRLWTLLQERVEAIEASRSLVEDGSRQPLRDLDDRVWAFRDEKRTLQLSWNVEYSLATLPTLFMDASANPRLLSLTLGREPSGIVCKPIAADLRLDVTLIDDTTYTKRRYFPGPKASVKQRTEAQRLMRDTRAFLAKTAAVHGDGGTLFVAPMAVEEAILDKWSMPENMDSMHFGAVAGLDWAKHHRAAVLVGALYPDVATIDGLVAALTWRDPNPPERMDPDGTGAIRPFEMVDEAIPLRDGTFHSGRRLEYPGAMATDILEQVRDEQLVQALGRLRSVYREDVPRLYILGNAVPRGLIVDRVSTMQRELDNLGGLLAAAHDDELLDGRICRELAEKRSLTAQFRRFAARYDADPEFAAAFHCVEAPGGEREWLPAYAKEEFVEALATACGGTAKVATVKAFGRPSREKRRKGLSEDAMNLMSEMYRKRLVQTLPVEVQVDVRSRLRGPAAEAELYRLYLEREKARDAAAEIVRLAEIEAPPLDIDPDDIFSFISPEAIAIPVDW